MSEQLGFRHSRVQRLRRLLRQRSYRRSERAFVAEGAKVLEAALHANAPLEGVYASPEASEHEGMARVLAAASAAGIRVYELERGVMERVADTVTPQPLLGVVALEEIALAEVSEHPLLVVLVDVRDPGNVGAIIRSADASGAGAVVCCAGSGDPYNPKAVRASAGSLFNVPVATTPGAIETLGALGEAGYRRLSTSAIGGEDYAGLDWSGKVALLLGNEASGLPEDVGELVDGRVSIPIEGAAESLNVAMAATVLCFEAARRRRLTEARPTMAQ